MRINSINCNQSIFRSHNTQKKNFTDELSFKQARTFVHPLDAIVQDMTKGIVSANVTFPLNCSTENILKALKRNNIVPSWGGTDNKTFAIGFFEEFMKKPIATVSFTLEDARAHFKNPNIKCGDVLGYGWALGNMKEYAFWHGQFNKALAQMLGKIDPAYFAKIERHDIRKEEKILDKSKLNPELVKLIDANYNHINEFLEKLGLTLQYGIYDLGPDSKSICREWLSVRLIDKAANKQISGASSTPDSTFEVAENGCGIEGALYAWAKLFDHSLSSLIKGLPKDAFNPMMPYKFKSTV